MNAMSSAAAPRAVSRNSYTTRRTLLPVALIVAVFAITRTLAVTRSLGVAQVSLRGDIVGRTVAALSGASFDAATLGQGVPLLDPELLRQDLARSLWYLHVQPPLFNLLVAGVLRLPHFALAYQYLNWGLGLVLYLACYALMRGLGAAAAPATLAVLLFLIGPNALWAENAVYYGVAIAALLAAAAWSFHRALARGSLAWLGLFAATLAIIPLTRPFFWLPWCAATCLLAAFAFVRCAPGVRDARRAALFILAAPVVLVLAFQVKQILLFGLWNGSSWFGSNLTAMTAGMGKAKEAALAAGKVSPLVMVYRNDSVETYRKYATVADTGIPALDLPRKSTGQPNSNNLIYVPICRQFFKDSLYLILHNPVLYLGNVVNSVYIFSGYQIGVVFEQPHRFLARWSWLELAAPFLGFPLIAAAITYGLRRTLQPSRLSLPARWTVAFLTWNVVYVAAVACLLEKSEGPLYRYQVDAFLWILLALAATEWLQRRKAGPAAADVRN